MKAALYGRIVFGASAMLFGIIALMWRDPDTWQSLVRIWKLPFGTVIGQSLMVVLIAAGIGILFPRTTRLASIVLTAVFGVFSLACAPGIIAAPKVYFEYGSFFEEFSLFCGALGLYAATAPSAARASATGRLARIGLGLCATSFMLAQIFYPKITADLVPTWIPPSQMFWVILTTVAFGLAALAILIDRQARLATRLMTLMIVLFGLLVWLPRVVAHPEAHGNWSEFALNFLIAGAAWMVAEAPPS